MAEDEVRVGDVGTHFEFVIVEDEEPVPLDPADNVQIIFKKPNRTVVTVDMDDFVTDGSDGEIYYVVKEQQTGYFIDQAGKWEAQAKVITDLGTWRSDIQYFWVHRNLDD